jgi:cytosine/adenosine deaminase-related metal-dependent hydrolase
MNNSPGSPASHGSALTDSDWFNLAFEQAQERILFARWVLPMSGPPIRDGAVSIQGTRIKAVCSAREICENYSADRLADCVLNYGNAIISPGLINLHTHLDSSFLNCLNVDADLFAWIQALMRERSTWDADTYYRSTLYGAQQAALSGTSLVVDSSYSGLSARALSHVGLRGLIGLELFGLQDGQVDGAWNFWLQRLEKLENQEDTATRLAIAQRSMQFTVAPHAPYTVCPSLWKKAATWAKQHNLPVLAHVSESICECQWLACENETVDRFHDFVRQSIGKDKVAAEHEQLPWRSKGLTPVQHLEEHGLLNEQLVAAHATQVNACDLEILRRHRAKVAHCPRSNARLRNGRAPLSLMQSNGITVGLGTDSLASCDDLDLRHEARFALGLHRAAEPDFAFGAEDALKAITIESARALGIEGKLGSLQPGYFADLCVFTMEPHQNRADNPYEQLIHGQTPLRDLIVSGKLVVRNSELISKMASPLPV